MTKRNSKLDPVDKGYNIVLIRVPGSPLPGMTFTPPKIRMHQTIKKTKASAQEIFNSQANKGDRVVFKHKGRIYFDKTKGE